MALAKDPADRYPTCGELIADAREALGITEPKRNPWPIAVAAVGIALIAAALAGYFLTQRGDGCRKAFLEATRSFASTPKRTPPSSGSRSVATPAQLR